jgi:hypothetical protein
MSPDHRLPEVGDLASTYLDLTGRFERGNRRQESDAILYP